ncbi:MAG TPA: DUF6491 family protein [Phenylobacterium sp.]|nr:DUF6491 family protein [Phenylobacterium sp.]
MPSKFILAASLLALAAASPALAAKSPTEPANGSRKQCFWTREVNNFAAADEHVVNVRVGVKDVYQFEMLGRCPDVDWNQRIALVSRGSDYICSGIDAEIVTHSPIGPMRCPVKNIHKLTPPEIAALPKRARP